MNEDETKLWEMYVRERSPEQRERLVLVYTDLVKRTVRRFVTGAGLDENVLESADLGQAGMMGLLDAIEKFDPTRGVKFETYALQRIHGAIQDQLRTIDWLPRSERKRRRLSEDVAQHLQSSGGDEKAVKNFVEQRSLSPEQYYSLARDPAHEGSEGFSRIGLEELDEIPAEGEVNPLDQTQRDETYNRLFAFVNGLPKRERLIITLHYYEGLKFITIAKVLKMSESRVSQIHATVIKQLREACADIS